MRERFPADSADLSADDAEFEDISAIIETICEVCGKKTTKMFPQMLEEKMPV